MSINTANKVCMMLIYAGIIILIPIFLDYLFRLTVRSKRRLNIKHLAEKKATETGKPLLIFNNRSGGIISQTGDLSKDNEEFECEITQCIEMMKANSFVVVVSETLEYVSDVEKLLKDLYVVSGGDLYVIGIEKNAPRIFFDYKIINIMDSPFYIPTDTQIKWLGPNQLQKSAQKFYSYVFSVLPYDFFTNDPFVKN